MSLFVQLPSNRTPTSWIPNVFSGVGIPSGIPTGRNFVTVSGLSTNASDYSANSNLIYSVLTGLENDDVAYIPEGVWPIDSIAFPIFSAPGYDKSISIRGAGMNSTILQLTGNSSIGISMGSSVNYFNSFAPRGEILSGLTKGSQQLLLDTGNTIGNGLALMVLHNDTDHPVLSVAGLTGLRKSMILVTGKVGNIIHITPPIWCDFPNTTGAYLSQSIFPTQSYCGLKGFTLDCSRNSSSQLKAIYIESALGPYIQDVRVSGFGSKGIFYQYALYPEVRHVELLRGGGQGPGFAGIIMQTVSNGLFEDNILLENQPLLEMNDGCIGNAFLYNLFHKGVSSLNIDSNHAAHNSFNLFEGNITPTFNTDGYYGSVSEDTLYRNWISAVNGDNGEGQTYGVALKRFTRNYSLIGNILLSSGYEWGSDGISCGQPNLGNSFFSGYSSLITGQPWYDLDPATRQPRIWSGVLTTRFSDTAGILTLYNDSTGTFVEHLRRSVNGGFGMTSIQEAYVTGYSGNLFMFNNANQTLPITGTFTFIAPGYHGFQELDNDVANTLIRNCNFNYLISGIPVNEDASLSGMSLYPSLARNTKPNFFGTLSFPPFNPFQNQTANFLSIPAGYRYINGNENYFNSGSTGDGGIPYIFPGRDERVRQMVILLSRRR